MKPNTTVRTRSTRPNRLLIVLAAAWMILSLAMGGAVTAETRSDSTSSTTATTTLQP